MAGDIRVPQLIDGDADEDEDEHDGEAPADDQDANADADAPDEAGLEDTNVHEQEAELCPDCGLVNVMTRNVSGSAALEKTFPSRQTYQGSTHKRSQPPRATWPS